MSSTCSHSMVNFGPLAAEIGLSVWGTPANFNGFHVLTALLHGSQVVSVSQTLRHWTDGATCVWQGDHHVGHWPTFLVLFVLQMSTKDGSEADAVTACKLFSHNSLLLYCSAVIKVMVVVLRYAATKTIVLRPFVWDYAGEPVPEETFTHPPSWSSFNLYQLLPSTTIHSILPVQFTCLAVFLHNLCPRPLWSTSWSGALHLIFYTFLLPISVFFLQHMPISSQPVLL